MSDRHDPDMIIAAWLDDGPTSLPPVTRQVIDSSIRVTPQRRRSIIRPPWGDHIMFTNPSRLVAAAVVAILLAGSGTAFSLVGSNPLGSDDPAAEATAAAWAPMAFVSGTTSCTDASGGTTNLFRGLIVRRGATFECVNDVDDERVNGTWTATWNTADPAGSDRAPAMWWGTAHREDAEGAWECSWFLPDNPGTDTYIVHSVCRGGAGYEGLTYVFEHIMGGAVDDTLIGYIYEGSQLGEWVPASE
jgi:hypothetical protein